LAGDRREEQITLEEELDKWRHKQWNEEWQLQMVRRVTIKPAERLENRKDAKERQRRRDSLEQRTARIDWKRDLGTIEHLGSGPPGGTIEIGRNWINRGMTSGIRNGSCNGFDV
jgi:hypothetical protein